MWVLFDLLSTSVTSVADPQLVAVRPSAGARVTRTAKGDECGQTPVGGPPCEESSRPGRPPLPGRSSVLLAPVDPLRRSIIFAASTTSARNPIIQTHIHMSGLLSTAPPSPTGLHRVSRSSGTTSRFRSVQERSDSEPTPTRPRPPTRTRVRGATHREPVRAATRTAVTTSVGGCNRGRPSLLVALVRQRTWGPLGTLYRANRAVLH